MLDDMLDLQDSPGVKMITVKRETHCYDKQLSWNCNQEEEDDIWCGDEGL